MDGIPPVLGLDTLTFPALVAALFVIVLARAQGTYWLGRAVTASTRRLRTGHERHDGRWSRFEVRVERWSHGPGGRRATALLHRWGPVAVTLSFLTVGIQTAVNGTAGLTRMPFLRYLTAMLPGCLAWALIYATVGFAAFYGTVALAARSPWALAGGLVAVAVGIAALVVRRRRRVEQSAAVDRLAAVSDDTP
ncbi:DedA family protein [Pengzhenrongella phosphoraccumulans]|uniref:DedA family protein n=1 Tax=Pengzhenrongella phosphoraccumulans TaxID=3114394 RepID=UPI00388F3979